MEKKLKRPEKKFADVKVSEADMIYFSLGLEDSREFVLPSQRDSYQTDERSVRLVAGVQAGKEFKNEDFSGLNLKGADISGGKFSGCSFEGAVFFQTKAAACDFSNCDFTGGYFEEADLTGSCFTGATFKRAFFKKNKTQNALFDEEELKYLTELEKLIRLIEAGEIDIRGISKADLLHLDVRRLDFSKIDLTGDLDLSVFALDGVNLCGTYIDPKQLMSLEGWNSYCLDVQKTKEKTRERLIRKIILEREAQLEKYRQDRLKNKPTDIRTKKLKRPPLKEPEKEENRAWGIDKFKADMLKVDKLKETEAANKIADTERVRAEKEVLKEKEKATPDSFKEEKKESALQASVDKQTLEQQLQQPIIEQKQLDTPEKQKTPPKASTAEENLRSLIVSRVVVAHDHYGKTPEYQVRPAENADKNKPQEKDLTPLKQETKIPQKDDVPATEKSAQQKDSFQMLPPELMNAQKNNDNTNVYPTQTQENNSLNVQEEAQNTVLVKPEESEEGEHQKKRAAAYEEEKAPQNKGVEAVRITGKATTKREARGKLKG